MTGLLTDIRQAARGFLREPAFTTVALVVLALGVGANTAIFSVVHGILLEPLPFPNPSGLVVVWERNIPRARLTNVASPADFFRWQEQSAVFDQMGALSLPNRVSLTGRGEPEEIQVQLVSGPLFSLLGVRPVVGRLFVAEDDRPGNDKVLISHRLWRRRFNADPSIAGRTITLRNQPKTVVGVLPPDFSLLERNTDAWLPAGFDSNARTFSGRFLIVFARLKPGVSAEGAHAEMETIGNRIAADYPATNAGWTANVVPLKEQLVGESRRPIVVLAAAAGAVLLIACANLANLLLARSTTRRRELAVRAALGAGRGRLIRQMLTESVLLSGAGGVLGIALAWWTIKAFVAASDRLPVPRLDAIRVDVTMMIAGLALAAITGVLFGLVPAFTGLVSDLNDALKESARGAIPRGKVARRLFVVAEVALALGLLVGGGLLIQGLGRLLAVDPGFRTDRILTMRVSLPGPKYPQPRRRVAFFRELLGRVGGLPGVASVGAVSVLPLDGRVAGSATSFRIPDRPEPPPGQAPGGDVRLVSGDYFRVLGIKLMRGRFFTDRDLEQDTHVVIINDTMARQLWPGEDAIGKRIAIAMGQEGDDEIVGVVGDVHQTGLDIEPRFVTYWPHSRLAFSSLSLTIRATGEPLSLANAIFGQIRALDPEQPVSDIRTMNEVVRESISQRRVVTTVIAGFAALALALALSRIYGVIAYLVTQRRSEIGVRLALGAQRWQVVGLMLGEALKLTLAGLAVGLVGAFAITRSIQPLLFDVKAGDPATYLGITLVFCLTALLAALVPGLRATRIDPATTLRAE